MTVLDEKEPGVSLKLIVVVVSLITFGAFGTLFFVSGGASSANHRQAQTVSEQSRS